MSVTQAATKHATPTEFLSLIAPGARVVVRDEQWLVRSTVPTPSDGTLVRCIGTEGLIKDTEAAFVTHLDRIEPLLPEDTELVDDGTPQYLRSRLWLEATMRKTPLPSGETALGVTDDQLLDRMEYQRRAAQKALLGLRPRLLIADAVGLGKTLEVGAVLSELIRRGRGERILVVTPRHILEQFQHELWTRFAIPLVRLDSAGIAKVRREIPANRNPFTHFKRAIISIDTLKNAGRYRHHLEGVRWDAVVIDECHSLVNRGTLNNQLAKVLAPRTDALLLTSATPHNGDPESFAELIRLLDPTAVVSPEDLTADDINHLYVRRHKSDDEVAAEVGDAWAERLPPNPLRVDASAPENALFAELADTWTHPPDGTQAPSSGKGRSLFPWTLFKAALSSHHALSQTIASRRATLAGRLESGDRTVQAEDDALARLDELATAIDDDTASKLQALIDNLKEIGVDPRSDTRVVIFSERIATLDWLAHTVPTALGLKDKSVRVLHGGKSDLNQMEVIEEFGLADADVRLLFTGDMASEGVNLHRQCHHMIHFDLPWSLITIEQRNGRIDRYGQRHRPDIRSLILTPDHDQLTGDVRILARLLEREHTAHKAFGDSGSLLGLHTADLEEDHVLRALRDGTDPDDAIPEQPGGGFDLMALLAGGTGLDEVPTVRTPSLFRSHLDFVDAALQLVDLEVATEADDPGFRALDPPVDLARRFGALPQSYLAEQKVVERLRLTATPHAADAALTDARARTDSQWPTVGYLSPLHPLVDWLADKILSAMGRNQAPVIRCGVDRPTFAVLGSHANGRGQPQLVEWMAVSVGPDGALTSDLFDRLTAAGVHESMPNPGTVTDPALLAKWQKLIPQAVDAARKRMAERRQAHDARLDELLAEPEQRLDRWVGAARGAAEAAGSEAHRHRQLKLVDDTTDSTKRLISSARTAGEPLVRVLALLAPLETGR